MKNKIIAFILTGVMTLPLTACSGETTNSNEKIPNSSVSVTTSSSNEAFTLNETAVFKDLKVTSTSIEISNGTDFFKPSDQNIFVGLKFTIENISNKDQTISSIMLFDAYADDIKLSYSLNAGVVFGDTLDDTISAGKKLIGYYAVEVPNDTKIIELEVKSSWLSNSKAIFKFDITDNAPNDTNTSAIPEVEQSTTVSVTSETVQSVDIPEENSPEKLFDEAIDLFYKGDILEYGEKLKQLLTDYPDSDIAINLDEILWGWDDSGIPTVTVAQLIADYESNEIKADSIYKDKLVLVTGIVDRVSKDTLGNVYVSLGDGEDFSLNSIQCYFLNEDMVSELKKGDSIQIAGKCIGITLISPEFINCYVYDTQ